MPTEYDRIFRQDIREAPADDTPRLIYADWIEDHGDSLRAEFIRLQCRLARADAHEDLSALNRRERELLSKHGPIWRRILPAWLRAGSIFRRGFIDEFHGSAGAFFRDDPDDFFRTTPATRLNLSRITRAQIERLRKIESLPWLRGLEFFGTAYHRDWLTTGLWFDRATRLTTLRLADMRFNGEQLAQLLAEPWLGRVQHLGLICCHLEDDRLPTLLGWPGVKKLATLDLSNNRFSIAGRQRVFEAIGDRARFYVPQPTAVMPWYSAPTITPGS